MHPMNEEVRKLVVDSYRDEVRRLTDKNKTLTAELAKAKKPKRKRKPRTVKVSAPAPVFITSVDVLYL